LEKKTPLNLPADITIYPKKVFGECRCHEKPEQSILIDVALPMFGRKKFDPVL